jgi:hypothetical protein
MPIDIPDDLHRRLEQLAKGTGQDVSEAIEPRLALEGRKPHPLESPAWQPFSDQDPFVSLIGSGEDDAADVSQKKYNYLADTCRP